MRVEIGAAQPAELTRITQLINKTNQFNLRTKRYSEAEITETAQDSNRALIRVSLTDKFSQYGIISALILSRDSAENTLFIDTWVMSCRVFQRRLEYRTMNWLVDFARSRQVPLLMAEYIPSERNKLTAELYEELGFELISEEFGIKKYRLDVKRYNPFETWFEEESENGQSPKITRPDA
jgi:FkbH-like protein